MFPTSKNGSLIFGALWQRALAINQKEPLNSNILNRRMGVSGLHIEVPVQNHVGLLLVSLKLHNNCNYFKTRHAHVKVGSAFCRGSVAVSWPETGGLGT